MQCEIVVSDKMGHIPLAECGGILLQPGERLLVTKGVYEEMKRHYGKNLISAGQLEKDKLSGGHYELQTGLEKKSEKASVHAAKHEGHEPEGAEAVASDKSMQGKTKVKRKG